MRFKRLLIAMALAVISIGVTAQNTATLYFMDEIAERNNMNPAFIPRCNVYVNFFLLPNFSLGWHTSNMALRNVVFNKNEQTFSFLRDKKMADQFYNRLAPISTVDAFANVNLLNFGFRVKQHYFTFDAGIQVDAAVTLPKDVAKLAIYGIPDDNNIHDYSFRHLGVDVDAHSYWGVGYMNQLNDKWTIGVKAKVLAGYANAQSRNRGFSIHQTPEDVTVDCNAEIDASLPANIYTRPDHTYDTTVFHGRDEIMSLITRPAGLGAAFDFGFTYKPTDRLTLSAAVTDLGFIRWYRNTKHGEFNYHHNLGDYIDENVVSDDPEQAALDRLEIIRDDARSSLTINDNAPGYATMTYATFSAGVEYGFLDNKISLGGLNRLRFNNRMLQDEVTFAANFRPLDCLRASLSYSFLNGRGSNIGVGLNLRAGCVNMYIIADYLPLAWRSVYYTDENDNVQKQPLPWNTQKFNLQGGVTFNLGRGTDKDHDGVKNRKDRCPDTDIPFLQSMCPDVKRKNFVNKDGCIKDEDGDGVHDCYDKCPNTPAGVQVDEFGCPLDSDKDGVADYIDQCPNTPEGIKVDEKGCPIDDDNDGVHNYIDQCPNTPAGVQVDEKGCPVDSDNDGVPDYLDQCPNTPANCPVDEKGCPFDDDNDGVPNNLDQCPNTPAGVQVDEKGCPLDSDGDGVPDYLDQCPNTPGSKDNHGCPELKREVKNLFKKAMNGIQFETGSDVIKKVSFPILDQIVKVMEDNPTYKLFIAGHTDDVGADDFNMRLSEKRAASVRKYLIDKGIDDSRLTSQGFGKTKPIASNKTAEGRRLNRRVEFEVSFETITIETTKQIDDQGNTVTVSE